MSDSSLEKAANEVFNLVDPEVQQASIGPLKRALERSFGSHDSEIERGYAEGLARDLGVSNDDINNAAWAELGSARQKQMEILIESIDELMDQKEDYTFEDALQYVAKESGFDEDETNELREFYKTAGFRVIKPEAAESVESDEPKGYRIELFKFGKRSTADDKLAEQVQYIVDSIFRGSRSRRWDLKSVNRTYKFDHMTRQHEYRASIVLVPTNIKPENIIPEFLICMKIAKKAASTQRWEAEDPEVSEVDVASKIQSEIDWQDTWYEDYFSHIFGRKNQIEIIMSALRAGLDSDFENRFHCVMFGAPACGKSEIARSFRTMLGEDAVLEFDATSTTQAGAIKELAERPILPKVLVIEEIEKTNEDSLRYLLSVLDHRGEIRKQNFNVSIQRDVKLLCIATANDYELFNKLMYGALASRFAHHIYCPRPDEEILRMILTREVAKVQGKLEWIQPAIEFAQQLEITDPRKVTAICLSGTDELLTGEYQKKLIAVMMPGQRKTTGEPKIIKSLITT